jgi:hypothetical protein
LECEEVDLRCCGCAIIAVAIAILEHIFVIIVIVVVIVRCLFAWRRLLLLLLLLCLFLWCTSGNACSHVSSLLALVQQLLRELLAHVPHVALGHVLLQHLLDARQLGAFECELDTRVAEFVGCFRRVLASNSGAALERRQLGLHLCPPRRTLCLARVGALTSAFIGAIAAIAHKIVHKRST